MTKLLSKEFRLAMHPTCYIFLALSAMLLIPNYPYYVTFFYTGLGVFFTCLSGRENNDIDYMLLLPLQKKDAVRARFGSTVVMEALQFLLAAAVTVLRGVIGGGANQAGMDANIAFFGLAAVMMGIFNLVFFTRYYKNVDKVGGSFMRASTAVFGYMLVAEACTFVVPFFKEKLDTPDPQFLTAKLVVLAVGLVVGVALTALSYRISVKEFERLDM